MWAMLAKWQARFDRWQLDSASLLGASLHAKWPRRCVFALVVFSTVFGSLFMPAWAGLLVLTVDLWLLGAVYWTWGCNEIQRGRIAKKIDSSDPDALPRMQDLALMTAVATPVVLILLFDRLQSCFGLFLLRAAPSFADWLYFLLDKTYLRALPDYLEMGITRIEDIHKGRVDYLSGTSGIAGKVLVTVAYLILYWILLQGLLRVWQLQRDLSEGVEGVALDPDMAVRLGHRAVPLLLAVWEREEVTPPVRANIATALGRIGDPTALPVLEKASREPTCAAVVREAVLLALGDLDHVESVRILEAVLLDGETSAGARAAAAEGLGRLSSPAAGEPLLAKLRQMQDARLRFRDTPAVRKEVVEALGNHLGARRTIPGGVSADLLAEVVSLILSESPDRNLLRDEYLRVRNRSATALSQLGDARAIGPLTALLSENDNPKLLQAGAEALGRLLGSLPEGVRGTEAGQEAIAELVRLLVQSRNESVRESAARGLGLALASSAQAVLWAEYERALREDEEGIATATGLALVRISPENRRKVAERDDRLGREGSQRRRERMQDERRPLAERVQAARELGEIRDRRSRQMLQRIADDADEPEALRSACREALQQVEAT